MIALKYSVFAVISIIFNLAFQALSFFIYHGNGSLYMAMAAGTLAGLISKYILDKKYIFSFVPKNKADDAKRFVLYTMMGLMTTAIFWATELAFDRAFKSEYAKYIGAMIGLTIGYTAKYFLDKSYVFNR